MVFKSLSFKEMVLQVADLKICPNSLGYGSLSAWIYLTFIWEWPCKFPERWGDSSLYDVSFKILWLMAYIICLTSQFIYSVAGTGGYVNVLPNKWVKDENPKPVSWAVVVVFVNMHGWNNRLFFESMTHCFGGGHNLGRPGRAVGTQLHSHFFGRVMAT